MIKLVFCARRLPSLSRYEFQRYWREVHGPLVLKHAAVLRIRRYVQLHTLDDPIQDMLRTSRGGPEPFDGIAELWWNRREDLAGGADDPAWRQAAEALLEDERRFIDLARSPLWIGEEHVVID
jgi:uncharacterized protein (TIGR02118 family)